MFIISMQSHAMELICPLPTNAMMHAVAETVFAMPPYDMYYAKLTLPLKSTITLGSSLLSLGLIGSFIVGSTTMGFLLHGRQKLLVDAAILNNPWWAHILIKIGANPYKIFQDQNLQTTPLHEIVKCHSHVLLQLFLSISGDVNVQDSDGNTPVHLAAMNAEEDAAIQIQELYEHGACLQATDIIGHAPLHIAMQYHAHAATEKLLQFDVDVNAQDFYGNTALHDAAASENLYGIIRLLQYGAHKDILNNSGLSACDVAQQYGHQSVVDMLAAQRRCLLNLDNALPQNPQLKRISRFGTNIMAKLFNREIGK